MIGFVKTGRPVRAANAVTAIVTFMLGSGIAMSHPAFAAEKGKTDSTLAHVLETARPDTKGWTAVIVQLAPGTSAKSAEKAVTQLGGDVFRHLEIIQSFAVRIPTKNLQKLVDLACVAHLSSDVETRKSDDFTVQHSGADVATKPYLMGGYGLSGSGVTVAVLDSGIKSTKDFENIGFGGSRLVSKINFVPAADGKIDAGKTDDLLGHGTHVAGIIAGNGTSSTGLQYFKTFKGIAPSAKLVNVRVLDDQGGGTVSSVLAGLNWIVQNKAKYSIDVVNVSLGHPVYESIETDPLNKAVEAAWKAGIVVVCSAGNSGRTGDESTAYPGDNEGYGTEYGTIQCPGNDPLVITVGAMKNMDGKRANDKVATYSSRGPSRIDMVIKPDLMAPGNRVVSVCADKSTLDEAFSNTNDILMSEYQYGGKDEFSKQYFELSGTSMAAPVVAGAAALLLEKYPTLSPDTIKARLMLSADKLVSSSGTPDVLTYGAGYLNIPAALRDTTVVPTTSVAASPTLIVAADGTLSVFMDQALWGKASAWSMGVSSLQALWGKAAINASGFVWADQALWGKASSVKANQALWGKARATSVDVSANSVYGE